MKRNQRPAAKPLRAKPESKAAWPESHSGEGSASALETLQKLESRRRLAARSIEPRLPDDPKIP